MCGCRDGYRLQTPSQPGQLCSSKARTISRFLRALSSDGESFTRLAPDDTLQRCEPNVIALARGCEPEDRLERQRAQ